MNTLKNNVQLIGRLGKNPEVKTFDSGKTLATFSVATNESYRNAKGEKVEETQWHNIVAWGKLAEVASKYLKKGSEVALQGKLIHRDYESNGVKKYITEINVHELMMLGSKEKE
ncbi:MAG TPA: single-stranded DNA-binding protein [Cyclobacteriaceae bacterium]|nr:single-stranded DNA-binding protein [Cyclobacteriaceae bacterium]